MVLRRFFLVFLIVLNLGLAYRIVFSDQGIYSYRELKGRQASMQAQLQAVDDKCLGLSQEIRWLQSDRAYIERVIRAEMNFLKENEILYLFPESGAKEQEQPGERADERQD